MTDDEAPPPSEFLLYQTEDGRTRIQCRLEEETIWLTQLQLAELFQTTVANINMHLKAIYAEGELTEAATIKPYLIVRTEGTRQVSREVMHYSLPAILAVGYRVRSHRHDEAATAPHSAASSSTRSASRSAAALSRVSSGFSRSAASSDAFASRAACARVREPPAAARARVSRSAPFDASAVAIFG
ncbi:hypothetical protein GF068_26400 [Polyangium spumosum]|uniref:Death-on-curing protein n=1 Tax=Polyangium spumosum TaxID=889282 RepID=A0A6N7PT74_9BACT|nr:hypothetical protein [Polyangium spumosum]